jgi:predicted nucleic acid-binding protein
LNLVDSCGWIEYFAEGPGADFYAPALQREGELLVPTICIAEVFRKVMHDMGEDAALRAAAAMKQGSVVDLDFFIALKAARIGSELKMPLADSIVLATAREHKALLWTQDEHFRGLGRVRFFDCRKK